MPAVVAEVQAFTLPDCPHFERTRAGESGTEQRPLIPLAAKGFRCTRAELEPSDAEWHRRHRATTGPRRRAARAAAAYRLNTPRPAARAFSQVRAG